MHSAVKTVLAAGAAAALLAVGACGSDEQAADPIDPSASPAASGTASPSAKPSASKTPAKVKPATSLSAIKVSGGYGKAPKVSVKAPWAIDKTRTKVLDAGDGTQVKAGQTVEVNYYGVNGRTGKKFDDSFSRGQSIAFPLDQVVPGFAKGLAGQRKGSRVLIAMPGSDGYDAAGGQAQAGINVGDTLIFVVDVVDLPLSGPDGKEVKPAADLPGVSGPQDKPTITVPKSPPPKTLQVQPLIKGTGKKVGPGDTITFDYLWVAYSDGRTLESSYGDKPATYQVAGLLPGMAKGLAGQTVGSRVLLVIPPDQGYPNGNASPKVDKGETLVMLVDLLFTQAGQ